MRRTLEPAATRARGTGDEYSIVELFGARQLEMKRHCPPAARRSQYEVWTRSWAP